MHGSDCEIMNTMILQKPLLGQIHTAPAKSVFGGEGLGGDCPLPPHTSVLVQLVGRIRMKQIQSLAKCIHLKVGW